MRLRQLVRPVLRRAKPGLRNLVICTLAGLAAGIWSGDARAQSGDFPVTVEAGLVPSYLIPGATCDDLRRAIGDEVFGTPGASPFDLILACSIKGRESGTSKSPCDLIDQGGVGNNVGVPLGQCLDSLPFPLITYSTPQTLEAGGNLKSSARGQNLATSKGDLISVTAVQAAAGKVLGVIKVELGACTTAPGDCPTNPADSGGIKVVQSESACSRVTDLLEQSVLTAPPELSHVMFLDIQKTGTPDFMTVAVCPGYKWTRSDPAAPPVATNVVDFEGLLSFGMVQGSVCFCASRLCVYCCAQRANGSIITPCPK